MDYKELALIPEGYTAIGLGLVSQNQLYLSVGREALLCDNGAAVGVIRLLLRKL